MPQLNGLVIPTLPKCPFTSSIEVDNNKNKLEFSVSRLLGKSVGLDDGQNLCFIDTTIGRLYFMESKVEGNKNNVATQILRKHSETKDKIVRGTAFLVSLREPVENPENVNRVVKLPVNPKITKESLKIVEDIFLKITGRKFDGTTRRPQSKTLALMFFKHDYSEKNKKEGVRSGLKGADTLKELTEIHKKAWEALTPEEKKPYYDMEAESDRKAKAENEEYDRLNPKSPPKWLYGNNFYRKHLKDSDQSGKNWSELSEDEKKPFYLMVEQQIPKYMADFKKYMEYCNDIGRDCPVPETEEELLAKAKKAQKQEIQPVSRKRKAVTPVSDSGNPDQPKVPRKRVKAVATSDDQQPVKRGRGKPAAKPDSSSEPKKRGRAKSVAAAAAPEPVAVSA